MTLTKMLLPDNHTIENIKHERQRPRAAEAQQMLYKIAVRVWPIMRKRDMWMDTLEEFCPDEPGLLGGTDWSVKEVSLRLRTWEDENEFFPLVMVMDTLLHELAHFAYENHDADFDAELDGLRNEYAQLEHDEDFLVYEHVESQPRQEEALRILREVASRVRPSLRRREWKVGVLGELSHSDSNQRDIMSKHFPPAQTRRFGDIPDWAKRRGVYNNCGQNIFLRLRHLEDNNKFLPLEEVVDTMLEQLCHIFHKDRDEDFDALLQQLRIEQNQPAEMTQPAETTRDEAKNHADEDALRKKKFDTIRKEEEERMSENLYNWDHSSEDPAEMPWTCKACTLINLPSHPRCDACINPRDFKAEDWEDDCPRYLAPSNPSGRLFDACINPRDFIVEDWEDEREDEEEDRKHPFGHSFGAFWEDEEEDE